MKGLFTSFILLLNGWLFAQHPIHSIQILGLKYTKQAYVKYFINSQAGDKYDAMKLEMDRVRLANLDVFADVKTEVKIVNDSAMVYFHCEEVICFLPILNFGSIEENYFVQLGAVHTNLLGSGHRAYAYYQYYDRHSVAIGGHLTRVNGSRWGIDYEFKNWGTLEPLFFNQEAVDYTYDNYTTLTGVSYDFTFRKQLTIDGGYFTERFRLASKAVTDVPEEIFRKNLILKLRFEEKQVNSYYYLLEGWSNTVNLQVINQFNGPLDLFVLFNEFKFFNRPGERLNLGARVKLGVSRNIDNPFAPFVLDSYLNIRGVGNRVDRGTGAIVINAECRYTAIDLTKYAMQVVVFNDAGSWRKPGGSFEDFTRRENLAIYSGAGLRLIHKKFYDAIIRIDYGFYLLDVQDNGLVIGLGQYF